MTRDVWIAHPMHKAIQSATCTGSAPYTAQYCGEWMDGAQHNKDTGKHWWGKSKLSNVRDAMNHIRTPYGNSMSQNQWT